MSEPIIIIGNVEADPKVREIRERAMSIHDNHSHGDDAFAQPFSPMGLFIIGVLVSVSIVLWQLGPSVGTVVLLPLMLMCPLTHLFMHRHRN